MPRPSITWLITDTHFYHNVIKQPDFENRPEGFEELILKNLRQVVCEQDLLIHLGDVIFYKHPLLKPMLDSVPCRKILTMGNHDRKRIGWYMKNGFDWVVDNFTMDRITYSHKPLELLPSGSTLNIHGHFHTKVHRKMESWYRPEKHKLLSLEWENYKPVNLQIFLNQRYKET